MKNKLTLIALFALFFAPVLVAVLLHSEWIDWQASPDKAHGELIDPVVPLGRFSLPDAGGNPRGLADLEGRWQLVHVVGDACRSECMQRLELIHNIRLAQDRHADEVGLLLLADGALSSEKAATIEAIDGNWLLFDGASAAELMRPFPQPKPGTSYIVDPKANIIERFGPDRPLNGIRKDLDRLLTWTVSEQE
ncbi:MAG: hypothetical protein ACNS61_12655 [Candidatus Wenzhouxiangella sp. M2_3B_020]